MLIVQNNRYSKLPEQVHEKYKRLSLLVTLLQEMAQESVEYVVNSFKEALKLAYYLARGKGLIQNLCLTPKPYFFEIDSSDFLETQLHNFLETQIGTHLWSSDTRKYSEFTISRTNLLTYRHEQLAKKAGVFENLSILATDERINSDKLIYTPFMNYLSPRTNIDESFISLLKMHKKNSVMNCLQFVIYALCASGFAREEQIQKIFFACSLVHDLTLLYKGLGIEEGRQISSIADIEKFEESYVFFHKAKRNQTILHALLYDKKSHSLYDLAFGKKEENWRVKKTTVNHYIENVDSSKYIVIASPISKSKITEATSLSENIIESILTEKEILALNFFELKKQTLITKKNLLKKILIFPKEAIS